MAEEDGVIVSGPGRENWCGAALAILFGAATVATADVVTPGFRGATGVFGLSGLATWSPPVAAMTAALVAWLVRSRRRASARGFAWCDAFGRAREVPWSEVTDVRTTSDPFHGDRHEVELSDGRAVSWPVQWTNAAALREGAAAAIGRGAYRTRASDASRLTFTYGAPAYRRLWWAQLLTVSLGLGAFAAALLCGARFALARDDAGPALLLASFGCVPLAFLAAFARALWRDRRAWRPEVVVLDAEGLAVRGGDAPFRVGWSGVLTVAREKGSTRVETAGGGSIDVMPGMDNAGLFLRELDRHLPKPLREAWKRREAELAGEAPTDVAPGVRRHHARTAASRVLTAVGAAYAAVFPFGWAIGAVLTPDDVPLPSPDRDGLVVCAVLVAVTLLAHVAMRRFHVDVTATGVAWRGLLRHRRFAWADVAEARLPTPEHVGLTLRLRDGTRLWCAPALLADRDGLVDAVRRNVATLR